ncbi:MAG: hypothetical protein R3B72_05890 [Polyangiaceae bacterium]
MSEDTQVKRAGRRQPRVDPLVKRRAGRLDPDAHQRARAAWLAENVDVEDVADVIEEADAVFEEAAR